MTSTMSARTGRLQQRYKNHLRLVAGCIPYRLKQVDVDEDEIDLTYRLEVLMISSPGRQDLVFPKGGWEKDESMREAACREALEEAGVKGIINGAPLGKWNFRSKSSCNNEGACEGYMFALEVTEELNCWPEQSTHNRKWVSVMDAMRLSRYDWMREAFVACVKHLSEKLGLPCRELSKLQYFIIIDSSRIESAIDVSEPLVSCFLTSNAPERAINAIC